MSGSPSPSVPQSAEVHEWMVGVPAAFVRVLTGARWGQWLRHKNDDVLDCRRANLEVTTDRGATIPRESDVVASTADAYAKVGRNHSSPK